MVDQILNSKLLTIIISVALTAGTFTTATNINIEHNKEAILKKIDSSVVAQYMQSNDKRLDRMEEKIDKLVYYITKP